LRKSPSKKKQRRDNSSTHSKNSRESSAPRTGGGYILEDRDPDLQNKSKISLSASKKKIPPFRETWNSVQTDSKHIPEQTPARLAVNEKLMKNYERNND